MEEDAVVLHFPALPESVPAARTRARRFVRLPPSREDALALLVTELVAGVVTGGPPSGERVVELRLLRSRDGVRVVVRRTDVDVAPIGRGAGETGDLTACLIERLADGWGEERGVRWIELRTHVVEEAPAAS
jgi:hypothetical protein